MCPTLHPQTTLIPCKLSFFFTLLLLNCTKLMIVSVSAGAEQASITLRTNIQVAQAQVEEAQKLSTDVNRKLAETKVEEIQRMAEYAAFSSEEHEVHEAYLRED